MISSRSLDDLHPTVRKRALAFLAACEKAGYDVLIYCTYRDHEAQDALYAQGRTKRGDVVTSAKGGQSYHNYRAAFDCVPLRGGKPVWGDVTAADAKLWQRVGEIGEACGLDWAGRWKGKLREKAHFQYTGGFDWQQLRDGARIP